MKASLAMKGGSGNGLRLRIKLSVCIENICSSVHARACVYVCVCVFVCVSVYEKCARLVPCGIDLADKAALVTLDRHLGVFTILLK